MMSEAVGPEVGHHSGASEPELEFDRAVQSTLDCRHGSPFGPGARLLDFMARTATPTAHLRLEARMEVLHERCAGLDVHKNTVVACVRVMQADKIEREVRTFKTMTRDLLALSDWLDGHGVRHVVMEATGVYWKPVWHILDDGEFTLLLVNAAHVKNVPGRKTDVNDAGWPNCWRMVCSGRASCRTCRPRRCATYCARASNWFASSRATCCACRRRWRTPTSNWIRCFLI